MSNSSNKTDNIVTMLDQYKTEAEIRAFATAQMKTITNLSKKINQLEEENKNLKKQALPAPSIILDPNSSVSDGLIEAQDEEQIAIMELSRLRDTALERPLTLEEARKVELYFKILNVIKNQPKTIVVETKRMSTAELLALASNEIKENNDDIRE